MRTIAVVNQKGGTGKTTTAVNLGAALGERGKRVLLVDLDPQYSTTSWVAARPVGRGVFDLFADPEGTTLSGLIHPTAVDRLALVGVSAWLVGAERALATIPGAETVLRDQIRSLGADPFDYLFIDCPPTLGVLTVNALTAAREVLVPVECHVMGLQGLAQLQQTVALVRKRLNPHLHISGVLACRLDKRTNHGPEVVDQLRARFPETYRTAIRENVRLAECPSMGVPVSAYAPASTGAADYQALADEVISQEGKEAYGTIENE
ncbi:ParA family protein [Frigoriglobus tundricola]|uniref:Chromosome (Plasmid) partitioning protein ParA n=1 Tax=Frigoriglobus tundricola TaxID=2774151 RepID=A0A6M5Z6X0_9BACT|nr:ParA family protein [Frigoriglobus tundricola]QJX01111.1 Chromosome (plasmid) partitioning protein ParA [Frigoriglobus tundricola]